jgi:hypothetical protein
MEKVIPWKRMLEAPRECETIIAKRQDGEVETGRIYTKMESTDFPLFLNSSSQRKLSIHHYSGWCWPNEYYQPTPTENNIANPS